VAARQLSTKGDSERGGAIEPVVPLTAKGLFDSPFECCLTQCDIALPLHLDHFRLIYRDGGYFEAHDRFSIALDKASRPCLIFVGPRGYGFSIIENFCQLRAVGNRSQEPGQFRRVIEPRRKSLYFRIHRA
jgi:hypothetical protein